jgi:ribosomal protein S3
MIKFSIGDNVAFSRAVVRRLGHDKHTADARGRVVEIDGRVVGVDFGRTFVRDDGATVRYVPAANLTKILANGVIYD